MPSFSSDLHYVRLDIFFFIEDKSVGEMFIGDSG